MTQRAMERTMQGILLCEHIQREGNSRVEESEGWDCCVLKTEVLLGWTCWKVHRQQVDSCSCRVVSKRLEMTSWKTFLKMGKWNLNNPNQTWRKRAKVGKKWKCIEANNEETWSKRKQSWLVGFYGISTIIDYIEPNPVYTYYIYIWFVNITFLNEAGIIFFAHS